MVEVEIDIQDLRDTIMSDPLIINGINMDKDVKEESRTSVGHKLWSSDDTRTFFPVADTYKVLPPDVYEARVSNLGPYFYKVNFSTEDLIQFEDSATDDIVAEIEHFWNNKDKFDEFGFPYRRGILMYGPPGSGKSCTIKLVIQQIIKRKGIGIRFEDVSSFIECMRVLRRIQPTIPVVAIMEDLESLVQRGSSSILNLLDGVIGFDNIVYLATTNYPEALEGRFKNRPSRFDRRFHIDYPNAKSRAIYIKHLQCKLKESYNVTIDLDRWVKDTNKFTPAHIKELFISIVLFNHSYEKALGNIKEMIEKKLNSESDQMNPIGFANNLGVAW